MSINRFKPHLIVITEDQANGEIANGFLLHQNVDPNVIRILPPAKGWINVAEKVEEKHFIFRMIKFKDRFSVLLIDFDRNKDRVTDVWTHLKENAVPEELRDRIFILGILSNPEDLRKHIKKSFEEIGESLAEDCSNNTYRLWQNDLLKHNSSELDRMIKFVKPFLFTRNSHDN